MEYPTHRSANHHAVFEPHLLQLRISKKRVEGLRTSVLWASSSFSKFIELDLLVSERQPYISFNIPIYYICTMSTASSTMFPGYPIKASIRAATTHGIQHVSPPPRTPTNKAQNTGLRDSPSLLPHTITHTHTHIHTSGLRHR